MIKRILYFVLVFVLVFSCVSCTETKNIDNADDISKSNTLESSTKNDDEKIITSEYNENADNKITTDEEITESLADIITVPELSFEVVHSQLTDDDYFNSQLNISRMVQENEWIYFTFNYTIYKAKANGENLTEIIYSGNTNNMWIHNGEVYIEGGWGEPAIAKINKNGTIEVFFNDNNGDISVNKVCVSPEGIYALCSRNRQDAIFIYFFEHVYSIRLFDWNGNILKNDYYAGSKNDKVNDFVEFMLYNGDIYYCGWNKNNENSRSFGRYKFDGEKEEILSDKNSMNGITEMNGKIFYYGWSDKLNGDAVYCINIDGTERTVITEEPTSFFRVDNGWIYYIPKTNDFLYRKNFETGTIEKLIDYSNLPYGYEIKNFHILGNWVYMKIGEISDHLDSYLCRMKTDGSVFETILSKADFELIMGNTEEEK